MGQTKKIDDLALIQKLKDTFKKYGYDGASLALLAKSTGLKKASLYHRFPLGKQQMAQEVLSHTDIWFMDNIIEPLKKPISPSKKIQHFIDKINFFYNEGQSACLLNQLSDVKDCQQIIAHSFKALSQSLQQVAQEAGLNKKLSIERAEQVLVEIQGALVYSQGTQSYSPFKRVLERIPQLLLK
jgi:hypothetical protein